MRPDPGLLGIWTQSFKASSYPLFIASSGTSKGWNGRETGISSFLYGSVL
jgi:gamma-glutamyl:cysteine ligase YbdK (ATP-grasp superfamily)